MGAHRLMLLVSSKSQNWIKTQKSDYPHVLDWTLYLAEFHQSKCLQAASGVKCKGAKIPDYELNITITAPSLLTSYFINLNWNWMKKIPYWISFKFALRGKREGGGVVFFQLKRETDAKREYFTPWLTRKLPNDPPFLRNCFPGQTRDWICCYFWVTRDILWPQRKHEIHKINNNQYKCW